MSAEPPVSAGDTAAALAAVRKAAQRKRHQLTSTPEAALLPTKAEIERAAALLADLWAAGCRHGIPPAAWAGYIDLAQVALHAASIIQRTTRPAGRGTVASRTAKEALP